MLAVLEFQDFAVIAGLIALLAGGSAFAAQRPADNARIRRLEQKVDAIIEKLGIELPNSITNSGLSAEARQLADAGQKIPAIKLHREQTGLGLKEAKDAVEAYLNH